MKRLLVICGFVSGSALLLLGVTSFLARTPGQRTVYHGDGPVTRRDGIPAAVRSIESPELGQFAPRAVDIAASDSAIYLVVEGAQGLVLLRRPLGSNKWETPRELTGAGGKSAPGFPRVFVEGRTLLVLAGTRLKGWISHDEGQTWNGPTDIAEHPAYFAGGADKNADHIVLAGSAGAPSGWAVQAVEGRIGSLPFKSVELNRSPSVPPGIQGTVAVRFEGGSIIVTSVDANDVHRIVVTRAGTADPPVTLRPDCSDAGLVGPATPSRVTLLGNETISGLAFVDRGLWAYTTRDSGRTWSGCRRLDQLEVLAASATGEFLAFVSKRHREKASWAKIPGSEYLRPDRYPFLLNNDVFVTRLTNAGFGTQHRLSLPGSYADQVRMTQQDEKLWVAWIGRKKVGVTLDEFGEKPRVFLSRVEGSKL